MTEHTDETDESNGALSRRNYMQLAGASIPIIGGLTAGNAIAASGDGGGPPNPDNWELSFEDDFDGTSLDTNNWGIGWGWGMGAPGSKVTWARERHVNVRDSMLVLTASKEDWDSDGVLYAGEVHSKNKVTVEPPVYFEAKMKFIEGSGWQNAFWSKPNDESWPPEIDVVEYLQPNGSTSSNTSHNLHYSASGTPGDSSTHQTVNGSHSGYNSESDLPHNSFHVYGVEWHEDVIRHYVDGQVVEETTDQDVIDAFNNGGAEYLMLSLNLDNVGTTDKSGSWEGREFLCDWVRVWDGSAGDFSGGSTDTSDGDDEHYFWARSETGDEVTFEFTASGGNIQRDSSSYDADYWVADDGQSAGGTTSHTGGQLPGFWYHGDLAELSYEGPLELYINDQQVDPEKLRTDTEDSTPDDTTPDDGTTDDSTPDDSTSDGDTTDDGSTDEPTEPESTEILVIDGTRTDDTTARYTFSVTGDVEHEESRSEVVDGGIPWDHLSDNIDGGDVTGIVGNGKDAYRFTGDLSNIDIRGGATFTIIRS